MVLRVSMLKSLDEQRSATVSICKQFHLIFDWREVSLNLATYYARGWSKI